jgi:superoxide oxidase
MSATRCYSPWLRHLHWLIALLVTGALVLIEIKGWFPRGSASRNAVKWGHMQFGIAVLLLMLPRLLVRLRTTAPPITPPLPRWQDAMSKLVHLALYVLVFALPLLGVAMMFVAGKPWNLLGLPLPVSAMPDTELAKQLKDIHETAGNVLLWVAIAHALAAVFHRYVQRDDTLHRMLPPRRDTVR